MCTLNLSGKALNNLTLIERPIRVAILEVKKSNKQTSRTTTGAETKFINKLIIRDKLAFTVRALWLLPSNLQWGMVGVKRIATLFSASLTSTLLSSITLSSSRVRGCSGSLMHLTRSDQNELDEVRKIDIRIVATTLKIF